MSAMKEVAERRRGFRVDDDEPEAPRGHVCHFCGTQTSAATLGSFGGRCGPCYSAYLRAPRSSPDVGDKERGGWRSWAHALKRRHAAGERLTRAQVDAYRAALGGHGAGAEP